MDKVKVKPGKLFWTKSIDGFIEWINATFGLEGDMAKWSFHLLIFLLNLLLSMFNIVLYFRLGADLHIVMWMGEAAKYINLAVPALLTWVSVSLIMMNFCECKKDCVQRVILINFGLAAFLLIIGSIYVFIKAWTVHNELVHTCGESRMTSAIQSEWQRLADFQKSCAEVMGRAESDIFVQECPDFQEVNEGGHKEYVEYIEDMEYDYGCQGFCEFFSRPLFNEDANTGERCADAIGEDVLEVGLWCSIPTLISGFLTLGIGQVLWRYDHL
jgi:hypothetical protein